MSLDLSVPPFIEDLSAQAKEVALAATVDRPLREDSWLIGTSREFSLELGSRGWLGMTWPTQWGGHERTPLERFAVFEALISHGAPIATSWFADRQIGPTLLQFGNDDQRRRWLPDIAAGRSAWCIGMSEPDAGSDVASIRTRATHTGSASDAPWRISGTKVWTSGATEADWCYLVARSDPDAPPHAGLSEFVLDMSSAGIEVRRITDATGNDHFCEVILDDVEVPAENLVGTPNGSFAQVMRQMEHERGGIDRLVSNRALYLDTRRVIDEPTELQRQEIARIETGYRIGRLMVLREVMGQAPRGWSSITKTFCTEFEQRVASFCASVAGPDALLWNRVSRGVCYAPAYTLMGGTTQILRTIMSDRILGLPRR
ncbi:MAG: acyl-CoA dehydrogenase family protein [Microthrixaceae bacterium]|nr:acyl-CoA dehydrogenase family protein [Microthrixaceae bacterium]